MICKRFYKCSNNTKLIIKNGNKITFLQFIPTTITSPNFRVRPKLLFRFMALIKIIPAYAGKTCYTLQGLS